MKKSGILIIALLLLALCWACDDNPTKPKPDPEPDHADFPDSVGLVWAYQVEDSAESGTEPVLTFDTVLVSIEGTKLLQNHDTARVWVYHFTDSLDTSYVYILADSVYFLRDTFSMSPYETLIFPLEVGMKWSEGEMYDSTRIDSSGTVTTPAGEYPNAYRVVKSWGFIDNAGTIETWLVPGEGMIKRDEYRVTFAGLRTSKWTRIPLPIE